MKREVLNTAFGSCPVNMPDEDILAVKKSAFSGTWEGKWTYPKADAALIVEEINSKKAKVIYCRGKSDHYNMPASCERYKAIVTPEKTQIIA